MRLHFGEVFLEVSIVFASLAILTKRPLIWYLVHARCGWLASGLPPRICYWSTRHNKIWMVENISPGASARNARVVLFDFDGTLSLIRSGWMKVMVPMMVEILAGLKTGETEAELQAVVEEFVWRLTGKETIYQMIALAEAIEARGGKPLEPLAYKKMYLDLLVAEDLKPRGGAAQGRGGS